MKNTCNPKEAALKSFFLGPQAENSSFLKEQLNKILDDWLDWRTSFCPKDGRAILESERSSPEFQRRLHKFQYELETLAHRLHQEIPKFSPRYIGHMFSELSLPALLGQMLCLLHNPNNVAQEASRVGIEVEKEAIQALIKMFRYPDTAYGHFTSGGTVANFEAVIRAKLRWIQNLESNWQQSNDLNDASYKINANSYDCKLFEGQSDISIAKQIEKKFNKNFNGTVILAPHSSHYSWLKAAQYFAIGKKNIIPIELDKFGEINIKDLENKINYCLKENKPILSIVSIFGSTELGSLDPIHNIQELIDSYQLKYGYTFWHHIDAAYGGFFASLQQSEDNRIAGDFKSKINAISKTTSIIIDPHKLGYVPYACGAFLCRKPEDYFLNQQGAPYVDFNQQEDLGLFTIEGSRSAAGAVATKMTADCIGFNDSGYGSILLRTIKSCDKIAEQLIEDKVPVSIVPNNRTNILCFNIKNNLSRKLTKHNELTNQVIQNFFRSKTEPSFYISKTILKNNYKNLIQHFCTMNNIEQDCDHITVIRLTIMNPFISSQHTSTNFIEEFSQYLMQIIQSEQIKYQETI